MPQYLYETISEELAEAIRQGVYRVNEKMPSLRSISQQYGVSLATAIQSYQTLEQQGLIESRPRSGYLVLPWKMVYHAEPDILQPSSQPAQISVGQLALSLVTENRSKNIIRLGAAVPSPELLPIKALSRTMAETCRKFQMENAGYELTKGNLKLRKQIVKLMHQAGCRCSPDDITITNGCLEAMTLALRILTKPGDTVAVESPTYFGVLQILESLRLNALEIATHPSTGILPEALKIAVSNHKNVSACILQPSFSNPLGSLIPDTNKKSILNILKQYNIPLIEDDVYGVTNYSDNRSKAIKAFDENDNVILCSSFSKTVAPGFRLGWIVSRKFREEIEYHKFLQNIATATLPQLAFAEFIAQGKYKKHILQNNKIFKTRMDQLRRLITEYFPEGTRMSQPEGGFVLWIALPEEINCLDLYYKAMQRKVAISPGILFSARNEYSNYLRLSCASDSENNIREGVKILSTLISTM